MFKDILKYLNAELKYYEDEDPYLIELDNPNDPKEWGIQPHSQYII